METIIVLFHAPIPVGHRVQIVWYQCLQGGLFGGKLTLLEHEPQIIDLDTGIEYVTDKLTGSPGNKQHGAPLAVGPGIDARAKPRRQLVGVVQRCRIVTHRIFGEQDVQTELTIVPQADV
jgi:hypothetical protein